MKNLHGWMMEKKDVDYLALVALHSLSLLLGSEGRNHSFLGHTNSMFSPRIQYLKLHFYFTTISLKKFIQRLIGTVVSTL